MTLSTNVYVLGDAPAKELFRFCQEFLTRYDEQRRSPDQQDWKDQGDEQGRRRIANRIGQGLPGILDIEYRAGAPLYTPEEAAECETYCEPDCNREHYYRACWLNIDLDTAYSSKFEGGMGCGDLHALFVSEVGQWLDKRGVQWEWRNEYSGEIHGGEDKYERLVDLVSGGFEANAWFRTSVLPAIAAHIAEGGVSQ